jgi:hypothetical protein
MAPQRARWHGGRMLTTRTSRLALLSVLGTLAAAASTAPAASAATQRYASPNGSGDCSSASPCSITKAVEGASGGDEVIVAPGDYPLTATLKTPYPITIHGAAGQPRPRLLFSGLGQQGLWVVAGSTLRYVEVDQDPASDWMALYATSNSLIDQVIAKGPGHPTASINNSTIRNSIVVSSNPNGGVALETASNGANINSTYRNVTAIATTGWAIRAWAYADSVNILARNVIARSGPGLDSLSALAGNPGTSAKITIDHSNWSGKMIDGNASIVDGPGNQNAAPAFVDAAAGDYRQAAGSPTINAGLTEFLDGPLDVEGDPRQIGTIDIGADEFFVAPAATTGPPSAVTDHSATLSGSVNPGGVPTGYWFEYGPTTAYGSTTLSVDAGSGQGAVAATATLGGLSPATTYHYRLVAANSGVVTKGADKTFTTASLQQPAPPPATGSAPPPASSSTTQTSTTQTSSTQTPTTPAFAGVRLVSTGLTFGGKFITLKVSCPAGTVGRCSGRTKLTAKRRDSAGVASTVTLGRAAFSIAPGGQARVKVRVSRTGRRLLARVRRLKGNDTNSARDAAGRSKTTVAAVTIRRRHR